MRRWNGIVYRYEKSYTRITAATDVRTVFGMFGLKPVSALQIPRLPAPKPRDEQPKAGKSWVQVLRSAPRAMQKDEADAELAGKRGGAAIQQEQNNCLKAMLTAIHGAQKFIYIEGQFFQSAYGSDSDGDPAVSLSGPMAALVNITSSPGYEKYAKQLEIYGVSPSKIPDSIRWSKYDDVRRDVKGNGAVFLNDLEAVLKNLASIKASQAMGKSQTAMLNPIAEALARRIEDAIYDGLDFHVYMVLPVHPEGTLNTLNIMTQLHLTMQSLIFGRESLVNRVRRAILGKRLVKDRGITRLEAILTAKKYDSKKMTEEGDKDWREYLTILNLRNWQNLEGRPVTEQIYVHSKLLIVDDRVAVLGSANINDRSQLGNRDSELAIVVRDDEAIAVKLDGVTSDKVSLNVRKLRLQLWRKLFGLMQAAEPANALSDFIEKPAARKTWETIQRVSYSNALAYNKAFPFLANIQGSPSSIWPTWDKKRKQLRYHMPFEQRFWRGNDVMDESFSWNSTSRAIESPPMGIQGFIVALPVSWTKGESNSSGMNLTLLAENMLENKEEKMIVNNESDDVWQAGQAV